MAFVVAVRMDDSRDFVVDPTALIKAPSVSKEYPIGCRVRITDVGKCYPKSDVMASTLLLGKWLSGLKPHDGTVATVLSSSTHPNDDKCIVLGVRSEIDGRDFVVDEKAVAKPPSVSDEYPEGANIRVKDAGKVYTKMDAAAKELTLSKWVTGTKPEDGEVGVVLGSTKHPGDEALQVIAIRTAKGQDFVIAPEGLEKSTSVSEKFLLGTRVYIANTEKIFPKMDDVAKQIGLTRWASGVKPVVAQVAKAAEPVAESEGEKDAEENPSKKRKLSKPLMSCAGEVKGSAPHPSGEGIVVGVRTETGQEFLVAEDGLEGIPQEDADFPCGARVKITDTGKTYPKFDEKAYQMVLTRWVLGETPTTILTGKVVGSLSK